ncbi:MAG: cupin domain-containing protein [Lachnospiraceae bacterium]|nr:cupin domain-containing protein [Lachnospiraceae bacterium]
MIEERIGKRIRDLRNKNGLTQEELAARTELTKGFISQLERGQTAPSVSTLQDIVECLGTNLSEFFSEEREPQIVYRKEDYFENEDRNGNVIDWLVASAQSRSIEPILIRLRPGTTTELDKPHDGEEFGYVLEGSVKLTYGEQTYTVRKGDSFIYPANKPHCVGSAGRRDALLLWVSTPPSF